MTVSPHADGAAAGGAPDLHVDGSGLATITLNRPRHLNRLHREDLLALQQHFRLLAVDPRARALVLSGRGRAFCAGFNLEQLQQGAAALQTGMRSAYPSGLQRAVSRLGLQAAKRLFLLAQALQGEELLRIGYLGALVPAAELDGALSAITAQLLLGAPLALQGMKLSLNETAAGRNTVKHIRVREARCALSNDLREGLAAFAERRKPRFSGR